ncbi:MAG: MogA/MoaB family molybdenum cofactor biosynthesis protein, partial [Cryobacterium sp.]|nr:MogA/MoaB family molybdenum cofactor biosynthesis protein [Cryobacterium sp.]
MNHHRDKSGETDPATHTATGLATGTAWDSVAGSAAGSVKHQTLAGSTVAFITVSDRSSRGERADTSGPRAVEILRNAGYQVTATIIPDGEDSVSAAISAAINAGAHIVITSGGTGIGPRDLTPEGTRPLITRELPGIAEELRRHGASTNRMAVLSRGLAGIADPTGAAGHSPGALIVNLPGSVKAVE